MNRKPIAAFKADKMTFVVLCEDGSTWYFNWEEREWHRLRSIPGSPAEEEDATDQDIY